METRNRIRINIYLLTGVVLSMWLATVAFLVNQNQLDNQRHEILVNYHLAIAGWSGSIHEELADILSDHPFRHRWSAMRRSGAPVPGSPEWQSLWEDTERKIADHRYMIGKLMTFTRKADKRYGQEGYSKALSRLEAEFEEFERGMDGGLGRSAVNHDALEGRIEAFRLRATQHRRLHQAAYGELSENLNQSKRQERWTLIAFFAVLLLIGALTVVRVVRQTDGIVRAQQDAEREMRESEESLANAQRIAHIGSWEWDIETGKRRWSEENYRIFGRDPRAGAAAHEEFLAYVHPKDRSRVRGAVEHALEGASHDVEYRVVLADGTQRMVHGQGKVVFDESGKSVRLSGTVQDITARKRAEQEIRALNEGLEQRVRERTAELSTQIAERKEAERELRRTLDELRNAQKELVQSEKMASLGGLVAGVAHEINTPVGIGVTAATHLDEGIQALRTVYAEGTMKKSDLEAFLETSVQSTRIISGNLHRASNLIRGFKQVAVDQSSQERRRFRMADYLDEILLSLRPRIKKTAHQIVVDCDPAIEVDSYPGAISQIVTNLVMNSLTHAFDDGEAGTIRIGVANGGDTLNLSYTDDGKGMEKENLEKIFDPFFTTQRGNGGSGLGMHLLYNLVTRTLGGSVTCASEPGKGIALDISFPCQNGG